MNNAINIVREIQNANPSGLRSLFARYGIGAETSPRNVILATMAFGTEFINELYQLYPERGNNFTGNDFSTMESGLINYNDSLIFGSGYQPQKFDMMGNTVKDSATGTKKGFSLDSFTDIFNSVAGMVGTGVNTYNAVKSGQTVQTPQQQQANAEMLRLQMQAEQEAADAKSRQLYIVGAVLVVVVILAVVIFKRK
jgi:hypothetical protein